MTRPLPSVRIEVSGPGIHCVTSDPAIARLALDVAERRQRPQACTRCHGPVTYRKTLCALCEWVLS